MSTFNIANYLTTTQDGSHVDIWTAAFNDMSLFVPTSETLVIGAQYQSNLPTLAADKLGSRYLWWTLLIYNGLADAVEDVKPGLKVRIPNKEALLAYLSARLADRGSSNYRAVLQATVL